MGHGAVKPGGAGRGDSHLPATDGTFPVLEDAASPQQDNHPAGTGQRTPVLTSMRGPAKILFCNITNTFQI